ncbi:MAG: hypothetical protein AB1744_13380, partial [Candidatus Zixiibacteriota bacterium]
REDAMRRLLSLWLAGILLAHPISVFSQDREWGKEAFQFPPDDNGFPKLTATAGLDYRIDNLERIDWAVTLHGRFYLYLLKSIAFKVGLGYSPSTYNTTRYDVSTLLLDLGIRLQDQRAVISPYLEPGFSLLRYRGHDNVKGKSESSTGLSFAVGATVGLGRNVKLDAAMKFIFNSPVNYVVCTPPPPDSLPPDGLINCGCGSSHFAESLYNPVTVELLMHFPIWKH